MTDTCCIFSLGKYVFEDNLQKKMWVKQNGVEKYANTLKKYVRTDPEEDIDVSIKNLEQGEHLICTKDMSLSFIFKLPVQTVKKEFPSAQFLIRASMYAQTNSAQQNAAISISDELEREVVVEPRNRGKTTHEFQLEVLNENEKNVTFRLGASSEKIFISEVELLVNPE